MPTGHALNSLSSFHPAVRRWFTERFGEPTDRRSARAGRSSATGRHTLIAAPTGSGKTLAAFLSAIDALLAAGARPRRRDRRSSTSRRCARSRTTSRRTCRARSREIRGARPDAARDPRAGAHRRHAGRASATAMTRAAAAHPGHDAGVALHPAHERRRPRGCCPTVAHGDRGRDPRPRARQARRAPGALARAAGGAGRPAAPAHRPLGDAEAARRGRPLPRRARAASARSSTPGTLPRRSTSAIEVPPSPLATVCSHEQWDEIYARMAELVREHRTTLVFVNTRKMAERIAGAAHRSCWARTRSRATTAASRASAGSTPSSGSRRARCGRWSRRRRSSWASTSATWTSSIQVGRDALDRDVPAARRPRRPRAGARSRRAGSSR